MKFTIKEEDLDKAILAKDSQPPTGHPERVSCIEWCVVAQAGKRQFDNFKTASATYITIGDTYMRNPALESITSDFDNNSYGQIRDQLPLTLELTQ